MAWAQTAQQADYEIDALTEFRQGHQYIVAGRLFDNTDEPTVVAIKAPQEPYKAEWDTQREAVPPGTIGALQVRSSGKQRGSLRITLEDSAKMNTIMSYGTKMQAALERHKEFIAFDPNLGPHGAPYLVKSDFPMNIIAGCILRQWDTERIAERFQLEVDEIEATKSYIKDLTS